MAEFREVFIGEVKNKTRDDWGPTDWGFDREHVKKKIRRRLKILIGKDPPAWEGRVARFIRAEKGDAVER